MRFERSSGILIHITSLPSPYGIGDMGPEAYNFVDFLAAAGQRYWQLLPLSPTRNESGNSPYSSPSAFAGNVLLISPEGLLQAGFLSQEDLPHAGKFKNNKVNFPEVIQFKKEILDKAFVRWKSKNKSKEYIDFCEHNKDWLHDYALYMALRTACQNKSWDQWPEDLAQRQLKALKQAAEDLSDIIEKEKFLQYLFFKQWEKLRDYAHSQGIHMIGDVPFYVNFDSTDCWAHTEMFKLNEAFEPVSVSGVPPDFFSETGQLWGTPVYDWDVMQEDHYRWWFSRLRQNLALFDLVRLDHFRAFSAFWEIPAGEETAMNGQWATTPGHDFFHHLKGLFPSMPFIAEDLGTIDQAVHDLRDQFELPGMRVLQYAFGDDMRENPFVPHNHIPNSIVYTGTHDNATLRGWYKLISEKERTNLHLYLGKELSDSTVADSLHRLALQSVAGIAVIPMQDILNLDEQHIMNRPGTSFGNWEWRMLPGQTKNALANHLQELNEIYGRLIKK
ncbi:MAG: 4-alpha-glucanotransferase [Bacteroidia bacterium]